MYNHKKRKFTISYLKGLIYQYRHAWILSYLAIYMVWFCYVEQTVQKKFHIITMPVDLTIPFCEYFIIPYLLWFAYVAYGISYFFFRNTKDYYKLCVFLFTGMTVFLIISTIYPNGHDLRPEEFARDNWCTKLVSWLYQADTPTNLFPSIHVYNSLGVHIALTHSACYKDKKICKRISFILCYFIVLSTLFLKQHSVFDVITAFCMAAVTYYLVYCHAYQKILAFLRPDKRKKRRVVHDLRM